MTFGEYTTNSRFFNYFDAAERQKTSKWAISRRTRPRNGSRICKNATAGVNYLYGKHIVPFRNRGERDCAPSGGNSNFSISMTIMQLGVGGFDHNFTYLCADGGETLLVDPTGDAETVNAAPIRMNHIFIN